MSTSKRFCPDGGWLLMGPRPVPDDPSDYFGGISGTVIGCNRLRCGSCGEWVRSRLAFLDAPLDAAAIRALYKAEDWLSIDGVGPNPEFRLYACACSVFTCVTSTTTLDTDVDPISSIEPPPWLCQGHPEPTLPLTVDG